MCECCRFQSKNSKLQDQINQIQHCNKLDEKVETKVLRIDWQKQNICLSAFSETGIYLTPTQKTPLKVTASIHDPLGIVQPIDVLFKILFKKISLLKCNRDVILERTLVSERKKLFYLLKGVAFSHSSIFQSLMIFIFKIMNCMHFRTQKLHQFSNL